ncbi:MAG: cupin domain protein [Myxococcaceae bacterium]|nr:cupin domain protein [Myxococcaceae bacterium]
MLSLQLNKATPPVSSYAHVGETDLNEVPIDPSWILEGEPVSRVKRLHVAPDSLYEVALWECNAGRFRWHFGCDEVVHILDGEVVVQEDDGSARTLRVGDVALFPKGSTNIWSVSSHVRKIAVNRWHKPTPRERIRDVVRTARAELKKLYSHVRAA